MPKPVIKLIRRKDGVISLRYPGGREVVSAIEEIEHPVIKQVLVAKGFRGGLDLTISSDDSQYVDRAFLENELRRFIAEA